ALATNNHLPGYIGDLRAQMGAAQLAARRLGELCERYGAETVEASVDYMIDYAGRRFREEVTAWPDGVYEGDAYVDHDPLGHPDIHVHVKITVDGEKLKIDYTGSGTRDENEAWSPSGSARGYTSAQIPSQMDRALRTNAGFSGRNELVASPGCW